MKKFRYSVPENAQILNTADLDVTGGLSWLWPGLRLIYRTDQHRMTFLATVEIHDTNTCGIQGTNIYKTCLTHTQHKDSIYNQICDQGPFTLWAVSGLQSFQHTHRAGHAICNMIQIWKIWNWKMQARQTVHINQCLEWSKKYEPFDTEIVMMRGVLSDFVRTLVCISVFVLSAFVWVKIVRGMYTAN